MKKTSNFPKSNCVKISPEDMVKHLGNKPFEVHNFETGEKTLCKIDDQGEIIEIKKLK